MAKSGYNASAQVWDGAMPMKFGISRAAFATAAQDNLSGLVAPCDLTVVAALIRVLASTTATAAKLYIGNQTASGAFLTGYPLNAKAAGAYDIILASQWTTRNIARGDYIKTKLPAATAVGSFAGCLVCFPKSTQV